MWCYVDLVLIPFQRAQAAAHGTPRGNLSDLYPRWLGARELLLHGRDPYSADVTREIQVGYYGRALDPSRPGDPKDQQGFAYPLYVVFLLAPTIRLPFEIVQAAFKWFLIACTAISVPLWFRATSQRASAAGLAIWIIFVLGTFPAVQGIKLQQLTLLVCALLAWAFAAIARGNLVLAGFLLAISTIKPQLVGIVCVWLLVWCLGDWHSRRRLFRSFMTTLVLLLAASNFILPGWISRFRVAANDYLRYTGGGKSLLDVLLTPRAGKVVSMVVLLGVAIICWRLRRVPGNSPEFSNALAMVMTATLVVIPTYAPYNQLLLLPAAIVLVARHASRTGGRVFRVLLWIAAFAVVWPWITSAMLDVALLIYSPVRVQSAWSVPLFSSLVIPLAVLGAMSVVTTSIARNDRAPA
jgi:hypothetical protein